MSGLLKIFKELCSWLVFLLPARLPRYLNNPFSLSSEMAVGEILQSLELETRILRSCFQEYVIVDKSLLICILLTELLAENFPPKFKSVIALSMFKGPGLFKTTWNTVMSIGGSWPGIKKATHPRLIHFTRALSLR